MLPVANYTEEWQVSRDLSEAEGVLESIFLEKGTDSA
jgi:hypothetical protein